MVQLSPHTAATADSPGRPQPVASIRPQLIAALAAVGLSGAAYQQGGFYAAGQRYLLVVITGVAVLAAFEAVRIAKAGNGLRWLANWPAGSAPAALISWTMLQAGLHGSIGSGFRLGLLVLAVLVLIAGCTVLDGPSVDWLTSALLLLGAVAGLLAWFGVLNHRASLATPGQGLWRASATLGYPNAAAALLAILALTGLALRCREQAAAALRLNGLLLTATLIGLAATLSRGGLLAFTAGAIALAATLGWRRLLTVGAVPLLGALVGAGGLLPSMPIGARSHYLPALSALLLGLLIGAVPLADPASCAGRPRLAVLTRARRLPVVLAASGLAVAGLSWLAAGQHTFARLGAARFSLHSADRGAAWNAVWHQIGKHPVTGSGPGLRQLSWQSPAGGLRVFTYAHDEYLQLFAELGVIGVGCLLACGYLLVGRLIRQRPQPGSDRSVWAAAIAAVVAVAVSVLFDFTGHFPAIPLTAAALAGCAGSVHRLSNSNTPQQ
ncbi:MAG: O-antigen ligase family protein [Jatrophihabitantaceae bacterium]